MTHKSNKHNSLLRKINHSLELIIVKIFLAIFRILGLKNAANLGSFLARKIGKRLSVNKLARKNISKAFPNLTKTQIEKILDDMWDNLGRVVGEFHYCCKFSKAEIASYVEYDNILKDIEHIKKNYNGGIFFTGHIGNWELGSKLLSHYGLNIKVFYRPLSNNSVDKITSQARNVELISKGNDGNKQIIREIKKGNYVVIFMDQRVNNGIEVPFFHDNVLTSPSIARLSLKYDIPLIPIVSIRDGKRFKFKYEIGKVIKSKKTKIITEKQVFDLTRKVNLQLESWIKQYPAQWFWVHNRWKK